MVISSSLRACWAFCRPACRSLPCRRSCGPSRTAGNAVKALQRLGLEFFELLGQCLGAAVAVVVVGFVVLVKVFLGHKVVGLVGVGEAVHHGGDDDLAFADLGGQAQDFGNGGRARR
jgi:hypothetical protein